MLVHSHSQLCIKTVALPYFSYCLRIADRIIAHIPNPCWVPNVSSWVGLVPLTDSSGDITLCWQG